MENRQSLRDVERLRLALQTNNRLNLEFRGSLSKILRDYGQQVDDYLLRELVVALPSELPGIRTAGSMRPWVEPLAAAASSKKSKKPGKKTIPPQKRKKQGPDSIPPQKRKEQGPDSIPPQKRKKGRDSIPPQKGGAKKAAKKGGSKKK